MHFELIARSRRKIREAALLQEKYSPPASLQNSARRLATGPHAADAGACSRRGHAPAVMPRFRCAGDLRRRREAAVPALLSFAATFGEATFEYRWPLAQRVVGELLALHVLFGLKASKPLRELR